MGTQSAADILAERVIADMEAGILPPWRKPWTAGLDLPRNARTGKPYRGWNVWALLFAGYSDPRWVTFNQAQEMGGSVLKGAKSTPVVFWKPIDRREDEDEDARKGGAILRFYRVFNVAQCDIPNLPALEVREAPEPIEAAQDVLLNMPDPALIQWGAVQASYSVLSDEIRMPNRETFDSAEEVYSTLFHEVAHSTRHPRRLDRGGSDLNHFGDDKYGREELVAEMSAALLCAETGIAQATMTNSEAYIAGWLRTIKGNPRDLLTAAAQAQRAVDYILGRSPAEAS